MSDISKIKNKKTLLKLEDYEGTNEYLLSLKERLVKEGSFFISPSTAEYIKKNINREPIHVNKVVGITDFYGEQLVKQFDLNHTPERILVLYIKFKNREIYV